MREILFKGKRMYDKEWGYGFLVKLGKESFSDPERYGITEKGIPLGGSGVCYNFQIDEVIPETVGQFTGLTDKNGKKIFEGDIIRHFNRPHDSPEAHDIYKVEFDDVSCMFVGRLHKTCAAQLRKYLGEYYEVIGNIHDNPELLKGEEK